MMQGQTYGQASGGALGFLSQQDGLQVLRSIEHDLDAQVAIVSRSFDDYLARGEVPAPHYAMRVAILLSKNGHKRHEMAFLAAWCKHFGSVGGATYEKLAARARKLGMTR
jgi:hypothetical protein